ncbi:MAG: dockerin type I domain-containing protein [Candidatus Poribacteria bacterium]|nr:dockerin type I domain-containing protein [Candidatus Poribacteria bacterium]
MKKNTFLRWLKPVLVMSLACSFVFTAAAQNYYPADIGNTWVFDSVDGEEQSTYTLEGPEIIDGEERILLKIRTEELSTGDSDTDRYFLTVGDDAIELHKTIFELVEPRAMVTADFPTPVTFFPLQLELGDKWQIAADADVELEIGLAISGKSATDFEVVEFEDVITPVGTFKNCAKVLLGVNFTAGGFLNLDSSTHQWFAPDIGPVQFENNDGLIFGLVSSNLLTVPTEPETTEEDVTSEPSPEEGATPEPASEEETMPEQPSQEDVMPEPVPYDVTGDGVVNILDLTFVASRFGGNDANADVTGDGIVNILDLVLIAQNFSN